MIIRDARVQIFLILILVWAENVFRMRSWQIIIYPLFSVALLCFLDLSYTFIKTKKWYFPFSSMVSGLLIGFLIHYSQGSTVLTAAILIAFLSKHFLKLKNRHIFNPAAIGTTFSTVLFGTSVSWWAAASGGMILPLLAISALILYRIRRIRFPVIFLSGYFVFLTIIGGIQSAQILILDGTVFLFSFIMLPEPMTSSTDGFWKWGFPFLVLLGVIASYILKLSAADPLLLSLLLTNLVVRLSAQYHRQEAGLSQKE